MSVFGERLKEVRLARGMSVVGLAHKADISNCTIWHHEKGTRQWPDGYTLLHLCDALDVSADYLLGRTNRLSNSQ